MIATATEAAIAALATILVSVVGLVGVLVQQNRTGKKVDRVYRHMNKVEDAVGADGAPLTFRQEVREGFTRNDADHAELKEEVRDHERRITNVEHEIGE